MFTFVAWKITRVMLARCRAHVCAPEDSQRDTLRVMIVVLGFLLKAFPRVCLLGVFSVLLSNGHERR